MNALITHSRRLGYRSAFARSSQHPGSSLSRSCRGGISFLDRRFLATGPSKDEEKESWYKAKANEIRSQGHAFRENARGRYRDFREHPSETAREGAKSFGAMIKLYGPVFIGSYLSIYVSTLGLMFAGVQSGLLDPVSLLDFLGVSGDQSSAKSTVDAVVEFMENHTLTKPYASFVAKNPSLANLAVAWIAVKFTEPIRFAITLSITPRVARFVGWVPAAK